MSIRTPTNLSIRSLTDLSAAAPLPLPLPAAASSVSALPDAVSSASASGRCRFLCLCLRPLPLPLPLSLPSVSAKKGGTIPGSWSLPADPDFSVCGFVSLCLFLSYFALHLRHAPHSSDLLRASTHAPTVVAITSRS